MVEHPGIEPGVPEAGDLQSPASPLMLLLHYSKAHSLEYALLYTNFLFYKKNSILVPAHLQDVLSALRGSRFHIIL